MSTATAVVAAAVVPVAAYATWYHQEHGSFALSSSTGKALYTRTTTFVDCATVAVPIRLRVLCPQEPLGQRYDPTYYAWHDERTLPRVVVPSGSTLDDQLRQFALAAIRAQPFDYGRIVLRDFALYFDVARVDRFEYDTAHKWRFSTYLDEPPTDWTGPAYEAHGGQQLASHAPFSQLLAGYQRVGYVPGPVLFGCLVAGLLAGCGVGRARKSGRRAVTWLFAVTGALSILVPSITADFSWRYQLPALAVLPVAAALAYSGFRGDALPPPEPAAFTAQAPSQPQGPIVRTGE